MSPSWSFVSQTLDLPSLTALKIVRLDKFWQSRATQVQLVAKDWTDQLAHC